MLTESLPVSFRDPYYFFRTFLAAGSPTSEYSYKANFVELRLDEVRRIHHGRNSDSVKLHSWLTTLGQQGTEVQSGSSSNLGCMSRSTPITTTALPFSVYLNAGGVRKLRIAG